MDEKIWNTDSDLDSGLLLLTASWTCPSLWGPPPLTWEFLTLSFSSVSNSVFLVLYVWGDNCCTSSFSASLILVLLSQGDTGLTGATGLLVKGGNSLTPLYLCRKSEVPKDLFRVTSVLVLKTLLTGISSSTAKFVELFTG